MAIIQKIRDKYAKLAGGVIAVALIGFVVNDAFNGKSGSIFGSSTALAKVNGDKIDPKDFDQRVREYVTVYSISNNNKNIDEETRAQINDQALRDLVYEKIVEEQLNKLGVTSSAKEEKDLIYGANPSPMVMQYPVFINQETGMFDPSRIKMYEDQMDQIDPTGKERENWANFKSFVVHQHRIQKFSGLVTGSLYAPKFIVDYKMKHEGEMASVKMLKVPLTSIPDNDAVVTDADINAYMEKNKSRFQINEESRGIEYVAFDVLPSAEDTANTMGALVKLRDELAAAPIADIPAFVSRNSEESYRDFYFTKKTFKSVYADSIMNKADGTVYGPYLENSAYLMVKVLEHKSIPDSVKAQHILVQAGQGMDDSAAHKLADSLKLAVESGVSFDSLAAKFSVDKSNNMKGGDLGYFAYGTMVPEFNETAFMGKTGDMKVVKTQFGYHILRINDQKDFTNATKLAIVVKSLFPSDNTETAVYGKATEFATKYRTAKGFDEGQKAMNVQKRIADNIKVHDFMVQGIGPGRELVRWMYDAKNGDVSEVIKLSVPNTRYIIAKLSDIQAKGSMKLGTNTKAMVESMVKADKKGDKIAEKYKGQASIESLAQAAGVTVINADSFTYNSSYIENVGFEPKAVGYTFSKTAQPNVVSAGMKGQDGVLFVSVVAKFPRAVNPNEAMVYYQQQVSERQQMQQSINAVMQDMLIRKSDVKYYNDNIR